MSEIWQTTQWIDEKRAREWRRACRFDLNRRYTLEEVKLYREPRKKSPKRAPKPNPELDRKLAELEADFKSSSPEAEARRQKAREAYQKWFAARKARIDKALEIIQASREKANGEVETL